MRTFADTQYLSSLGSAILHFLISEKPKFGATILVLWNFNIDQSGSSTRQPLLKITMCLRCRLLCPRCDAEIEGVESVYICLLKLQNLSASCIPITTCRRITPTEMVLTATSCANIGCTMSVAQQLIHQSNVWNAVDLMDAAQMAEHHIEAANTPLQQRAIIRRSGSGGPQSRPIPPVAGSSNSPLQQWPRIPDAYTPANLLLRRALSARRQNMRQARDSGQLTDKKAFWRQEINNALISMQRAIYLPAPESQNMDNFDNRNQAALETEYAMLCCPDDTPPSLPWSEAGGPHQSGSLQASGSGMIPAPGPGPALDQSLAQNLASPAASWQRHLLPASGSRSVPPGIGLKRMRMTTIQAPVASRSAAAGSQLEAHPASDRPLQLGPGPVNPSSAATTVPTLFDSWNTASPTAYGETNQPGYSNGHLSQLNPALGGTDHNSNDTIQQSLNGLMPQSSGVGHATALNPSTPAPLPEYYPPQGQSSGFNFQTHQAIDQASSSIDLMPPNQGGFDPSSSFGHMQAMGPPSQVNVPAPGQPYHAAGVPQAGEFGPHDQYLIRVGGPTLQPGNSVQARHGEFHSAQDHPPADDSGFQDQAVANMSGQFHSGAPTLGQFDNTSAAPGAPGTFATQNSGPAGN